MKITIPEVVEVDRLLKEKTGKQLNSLEIAVLEGTYQRQKYQQIANNYGCTEKSVKNAASILWKKLSSLYDRTINKKNVTSASASLRSVISVKAVTA